jgi:integrase
MPHEEKHDPRWITEKQFEKLKAELPPHAQAIAAFAVYTGMRSSNIRRLKWSACDLAKRRAYVSSSDSKSGRGIGVQLSGRAIGVLRGCIGNHPDYVFTDDQGRAPVGSIKTTWGKAIERAGLRGFRFHDLRHTWAAWHVRAGTPPMILRELGGWSTLAMVERYGHLGSEHLADWADNSSTKTGTRKVKKRAKHGKRSVKKGRE